MGLIRWLVRLYTRTPPPPAGWTREPPTGAGRYLACQRPACAPGDGCECRVQPQAFADGRLLARFDGRAEWVDQMTAWWFGPLPHRPPGNPPPR